MAYDGDKEQFTKVDSDAIRILRRAREIVNDGWCQRQVSVVMADGKEHVCMGGGIMKARQELQLHHTLECDALNLLSAHLPPYAGVVFFNDTPGRTKEEVLAVFDRAIGD